MALHFDTRINRGAHITNKSTGRSIDVIVREIEGPDTKRRVTLEVIDGDDTRKIILYTREYVRIEDGKIKIGILYRETKGKEVKISYETPDEWRFEAVDYRNSKEI